jgi:hypothetical protein
MNAARFALKRDVWVRPLLALFTGTASRAWAEPGAEGLTVRFGRYTTTIPYDALRAVQRARWPWYAGLGWRTNFRSVLALVGSYQGVVEITLDPPQRTRLFGIPFGLRELYLSLDEPELFLHAIETRAGTGAGIAPDPSPNRTAGSQG